MGAATRDIFASPRRDQTFRAISNSVEALADGGFAEDAGRLVYRKQTQYRKPDPLDVILAPINLPDLRPTTVGELRSDLLARDRTLAPFMFAITMSLAIANELVEGVPLDAFIKDLGIEPRSTAERIAFRENFGKA